MRLKFDWIVVRLCILPVMALLLSQGRAHGQQDRIAGRIGSNGRAVLSGNLHPKAQPQNDAGRVDPDLKISLITLIFKTSPAQQAALNTLLAEQQDRSSPNYHHWLTPEEYADRFGLSRGDIEKVGSWLQSYSLTIDYSARGRNSITFSGAAQNLEHAFGTEIHRYRVGGETHFANSTDPSIPAELVDVVLAVGGLDDFRMKLPSIHRVASSDVQHSFSGHPEYTYDGIHVLAPDDIATIYDIARLYAIGISGSGQRIVVAGESDISFSDIATFRSGLLPVNVPQVILIPGSSDPGMTNSENESEADLDIEWIGAVARNAIIIYVNSTNAVNSAEYAISENVAPVISLSFAGCEKDQSAGATLSVGTFAQQASLQGITLLSASGDYGAAGCDVNTSSEATQGLSVMFPASLPEVTAVGGTEFNEGTGNYWSSTNSSTLESALSYIPEIGWNDTALGYLSASGGGMSALYAKPAWQTGPGVTNDGVRDVPDVAMTASLNHDGYIVVTGGMVSVQGGTSAATPVFAGIVALLNQYYGSKGEGNINPNLYRISQTNAFHDIVSGNNIVPCVLGTPNCTNGSFGYTATPGYDLVTGLGSVDAYNLIANWNAPTPTSNVVASCNPNPVYEQTANAQGYSWFFTITLTETAGVATNLTGFTTNGTDYSSQITSYFGTSTIPAHGAISASLELNNLIVPTDVLFELSGVDAGGRQWSQLLSVPFDGPAPPSLLTIRTVPSGLQFSFDGGPLQKAPQAFSLATGSTHSVSIATPQPGAIGTQYAFTGWSDGGAASQSFTVNASGTLTANFETQYQLTTVASPALGGSVLPANGSFYNFGTVVALNANAGSGYSFSGWTGPVASTNSQSTTITMSSPQTVIANFTPANAPTISPGGIVPLYSSTPIIQPGSWVSIYGSNLAASTVQWSGSFPTSLAGVSVTVNGKSGYLLYVSPEQVIFQSPDDPTEGLVPVSLSTPKGNVTSSVTLAQFGPSLNLFDTKHVAGVIPTPDGSGAYGNGTYDLVGPSGVFNFNTRPVKVGETLELFGVGFGPTSPPVPAGQSFSGAAMTTNTVAVTVGGVTTNVPFSGLIGAGLYQLNIVVPNVGSGDQLLQVSVGGAQTPAGVYVTVQ